MSEHQRMLIVLVAVLFIFTTTWCCCYVEEHNTPKKDKKQKKKKKKGSSKSKSKGADGKSLFSSFMATPDQDKLSHDSGIMLDSFHACPKPTTREESSENALFQGRFESATEGEVDTPIQLDERAESTRVE